ncbi:hypothetical protein SAMN05192552_1009114 [Natrinema hispanicum]|uniref:Uncharacterized protein n=1 Tax=Natrinema hispanicum TaxID=392421 RepID=A0A1G6QN88_9EURY|nr:hypothetical protein SAMN05192552_1009114 [Natrinema hispanicum]SET48838.1 hypothetical protein SAMN04488694_107115 [Natrinema hispanicum]
MKQHNLENGDDLWVIFATGTPISCLMCVSVSSCSRERLSSEFKNRCRKNAERKSDMVLPQRYSAALTKSVRLVIGTAMLPAPVFPFCFCLESGVLYWSFLAFCF